MNKSLILGFALCSSIATAAEFQYYVAPLQGITGISQSVKTGIADASNLPKYGGMINEKYADLFYDGAAQRALILQFNENVKKSFPTSVIGPNQIVSAGKQGKYAFEPKETAECSPQFRVGYKDTFAISIGISRLSAYMIDYGALSEILVPVTYTVRFTKLNGAATIFSKSETIYTQYVAPKKDLYKNNTQEIVEEKARILKDAILQDGKLVVDRLVGLAAKSFSPKQTAVTLIAKDGPYFIFDRGSEVGFQSNADFYPQDDSGKEYGFTVKFATDKIAVAVASEFSDEIKRDTNRLREGAKLNFSFESQGRDDAKLSVLAVQYTSLDGNPIDTGLIRNNALQSIISDDMGFSAPFNLIKQDPDFARLKLQIRSEANCETSMFEQMPGFADNSTTPRSDPDFLLKVEHLTSPTFRADGVGGVTSNTVFTNSVGLSLIDRSTIVRQMFLGSNQYELKRTDGKGLSLEQATEINLKNAALNAAKSLVTGFNPKQKNIKITAIANNTATLSEPISPALFKQIKLLRPLNISKANKVVMLPIPRSGEDGVLFEQPIETSNKLTFKGKNLKTTDILTLSASGEAANYIKACPATRNGRFLQHTLLKHPSGADVLTLMSLSASLKSYEFLESSNRFIESAEYALRDGFFQTQKIVSDVVTTFCVVPIELQQLPKIDCAGGKCNGTGSLAVGARVFNADTKVGESIVGANFEIKDVQEVQLSNFVGVKAYEYHLKSVDIHKTKIQ